MELQIQNLKKCYRKKTALNDVSFCFGRLDGSRNLGGGDCVVVWHL